jgi:golgi phosphoprotein 3
MADRELSLQEEFLLLCLNDETGKFESRWIHHGLAAAALGELLLRDRLALDANGLVHLKDATSTGDAALDNALARVAARPTAALALYHWVNTLADEETFEQILLPRLIEHGILRKDKDRFLIFFRQPTYPTLSPGPEQHLRQRIREAISGSEIVNERLAVLISLLDHAEDRRFASGGALRFVFTPEELQHYQARIAAVAETTPLSRALGRALQDVITADSEHPRSGA